MNRKDSFNHYGQIIVDECHHVAAVSYEDILKTTDATFVHGLTATPKRRDGHEPIMKVQCGPIRYKVKANTHHFEHVLIPKNTPFRSVNEKQLFKEVSQNEHRNQMILNDVIQALERGRSPVILTERRDHVAALEEKFRGITKHLVVLTGALTKAELQERLDSLRQIPSHEERLIIATGQYIGEGFDDERLDTLFLAMPISGKGKLQQYIGRLQRANADKTSIEVYDYVDINVPRLQKMYEKRKKGYKALGFKTQDDRKDEEQLQLF